MRLRLRLRLRRVALTRRSTCHNHNAQLSPLGRLLVLRDNHRTRHRPHPRPHPLLRLHLQLPKGRTRRNVRWNRERQESRLSLGRSQQAGMRLERKAWRGRSRRRTKIGVNGRIAAFLYALGCMCYGTGLAGPSAHCRQQLCSVTLLKGTYVALRSDVSLIVWYAINRTVPLYLRLSIKVESDRLGDSGEGTHAHSVTMVIEARLRGA
ncbi:hypothetical protein C8Q80DRAFT_1153479 [Daedaleopsis nitida]|nr:hypothetical protein C8Q80DRAFT_1153479 [Daedaleopsis nitida]